jgi:hypothetical protein
MNSASVSSKKESVPPRWKMALLTWIAVWPTSMFISLILKPTLARNFPHVLGCRSSRRWHRCYPLLDCHAFASEGHTPVALLRKKRPRETELRQEEEILFLLSICFFATRSNIS